MSRKIPKVKNKADPARNPYVVPMRNRTGSGNHGDKRKESNKNACRGKHGEE